MEWLLLPHPMLYLLFIPFLTALLLFFPPFLPIFPFFRWRFASLPRSTAPLTPVRTSLRSSLDPTSSPHSGIDIIIVGAGVAGSALANTLGKDGRKVFVIERDLSEPARIVGELLQPGGYLKLSELGLKDCVEGIDAQRVLGYALFKGGKDTKIGYPLQGHGDDVAGRSFHNGRFIQKMRQKAASIPTVQFQQGTAVSLVEMDGVVKGVKYRIAGREEREVYAPLTIICDGCFSSLRRTLCTSKPEVPSCFIGLVLEKCQLPYANYGHVILADPSPILFYPISSTEVRCLVDFPGEKVPSVANGEMAKHLQSVVAPQNTSW